MGVATNLPTATSVVRVVPAANAIAGLLRGVAPRGRRVRKAPVCCPGVEAAHGPVTKDALGHQEPRERMSSLKVGIVITDHVALNVVHRLRRVKGFATHPAAAADIRAVPPDPAVVAIVPTRPLDHRPATEQVPIKEDLRRRVHP